MRYEYAVTTAQAFSFRDRRNCYGDRDGEEGPSVPKSPNGLNDWRLVSSVVVQRNNGPHVVWYWERELPETDCKLGGEHV